MMRAQSHTKGATRKENQKKPGGSRWVMTTADDSRLDVTGSGFDEEGGQV